MNQAGGAASAIQATPDEHARGLLDQNPDPLRYDERPADIDEAPYFLRQLIPANSRVVDIGCGTGSLTIQATKGLNADVLGIEPDAQRAELARRRGLHVICGTADADILREHGPFDVIILADVLEHLPEPADLLLSCREALTAEGRILASIPNVAHWTVRLRLLIGKFDYQPVGIMDATHLRWFTAYSTRRLFARCGYQIVSLRGTAGTWMPEYEALPFRLLGKGPRDALIRRLARAFPRLFGCQFFVEARLARGS